MAYEPEPLNIYDLTMAGIVCDRCGLARYTTHAEFYAKPDLFCLYFDEANMRWRCVDRLCAARVRVALI
jgi:hypothetical protein